MRCYNHTNSLAVTICQGCSRALCDVCASKHAHTCERHYEPASHWINLGQTCGNHRFEPARAICHHCQQPFCRRCTEMVDGRLTCHDCQPVVKALGSGWSVGAPRERSGVASTNLYWLSLAGVALAVVALLFVAPLLFGSGGGVQAGASKVSPVDLVQQHYDLLNAGDYQAAWDQISPSLQTQLGYEVWANSYAGASVQVSGLSESSQSIGAATVVGTITTQKPGMSEAVTREARWSLVAVDDDWRLDAVSIGNAVAPTTPSR